MVIVCRKRRVDKVATMAVKEAVGEEEEEEEDKVEDEKWTLRSQALSAIQKRHSSFLLGYPLLVMSPSLRLHL
ncbi:hypothetical protein RUM44_009985 [Polyplax serrata]|uniref:Uncharacterized protein n=1 Tax=Polyplax serrata TaxID=468196 RepID=A0ABR1AU82_POLSC